MTTTTSWDVPTSHSTGAGVSTFDGIWEVGDPAVRPVRCQSFTLNHCVDYFPTGTITWTWESHSSNPTCDESLSGTSPAGTVNAGAPFTEAFELNLVDETHFGYWGSGTWPAPGPMKCPSPRGVNTPPSYFELSQDDSGAGTADGTGNTCLHTTWLIDLAATTIDGSCFDVNNGFNVVSHEWHLKKLGDAIPSH